ncbi:MAG: uL15 family ribosomal protein [Sulfolobales archaeon]
MVVRRGKKSRKYRGYRNQGYGSIGQHRKSGSRGGRGAVGFHKHKWSWLIKNFPDWYGKHGFTRPPSLVAKYNTINLDQLNELVRRLVSEGKAVYEGDRVVVDLGALGFNKLLGRGVLESKVKVIVHKATENALNKVKELGGEVVLTAKR